LPKLAEILKANLAYEFVAVGLVWVAVAVALGLAIVLWPALTCIAAGAMLRLIPADRLTWSWATSSAVLGFLVCGYQVYASIGFLSGAFSAVAVETLAAFLVFAAVHATLFFFGYRPAAQAAASAA